jgi:hypothetical protein
VGRVDLLEVEVAGDVEAHRRAAHVRDGASEVGAADDDQGTLSSVLAAAKVKGQSSRQRLSCSNHSPPHKSEAQQCPACFLHNCATTYNCHRANMSSNDLFRTLLRPAVLHILRASGFHYGKSSAVDTVVDLTVRYISLLAERTAYNAYSNHNDATPNITDIRMAMQDCGLLVPVMTAGEEDWKQILRKPLDFYNEASGARAMEEQRRDAEDTADVKEFIDWVQGDQNKEIRRIAGTLKPVATSQVDLDQLEMEDYLNSMFCRSRLIAQVLTPHQLS